jgi:hypothetical protein
MKAAMDSKEETWRKAVMDECDQIKLAQAQGDAQIYKEMGLLRRTIYAQDDKLKALKAATIVGYLILLCTVFLMFNSLKG